MARVIDIGDVPVVLEASDSDRCDVANALLRAVPSSHRSPVIRVRYQRQPPSLPACEPDRTYADLRVWTAPTTLFLQYASDIRAEVTASEARIGGNADDRGHGFARLFHPVITYLLAGHDRFVLHGASIARGDRGYLVLGTSGTGKSTLGLAALEAGWRLLGDDLAVIKGSATGWRMAGIARRTALPGDLNPDGVPGAKPLPGDQRNRWEVAPDRLTAGWFPMTAVILAGHSCDPTGEMQTAEPLAVLDSVLASFTSAIDARLLRRFLPCAAGLARRPAWHLRLPSERRARLAGAIQLLQSVE